MKKSNKRPSSWTLISVAPPLSSAMKNFILVVFLSIGTFMTMHAQNYDWAIGIGGTGYNQGKSIAMDNVGNIYVTGKFTGVADFDPGPDTANLTSSGNYGDIFIAKYSSSGNYIWAISINDGGSSNEGGYGITVDNIGNVYVTGSFKDTVDFDPGAGVANLISYIGDDAFLAKYSSSGSYIWAKRFGDYSWDDYGKSVAVDNAGNVYMTGKISENSFAKYDSSGNYIWSTDFIGDGISIDNAGNVYIAGGWKIAKYDSSGNNVWTKTLTGNSGGTANGNGIKDMTIDNIGNVYITGGEISSGYGAVDFDPGAGAVYLPSTGNYYSDIFFAKYDTLGNYVWAKSVLHNPGYSGNVGNGIAVDNIGNVYVTGGFMGTVDFDPGPGVANFTSPQSTPEIFIAKYSSSGNYIWAVSNNSANMNEGGIGCSMIVNNVGNIYVVGNFTGTVDFDFGPDTANLTYNGWNGTDIFVLKLKQNGVHGFVYNDLNQNCMKDINEPGLLGQTLVIQPGNYIVQTDEYGVFFLDSLAIGNYTATIDTTNHLWLSTCFSTQSFSVANSSITTQIPSFGLVSTQVCSDPDISIYIPSLRRCFSDQIIYVTACNKITATGNLDSAYADVYLGSFFTVQSSSLPYTNLGGNLFRFNLGDLTPGQCISWTVSTDISCSAITGQSLCVEAKLYPVQSCIFDNMPSLPPGSTGGVSPCTLPWDYSSLQVDGWCQNDSIYFTVTNTGDPINGDMDCFAPVRVYVDGMLTQFDSIRLTGGQVITYIFAGTGQTWRLEADQHPLLPGNSHPNAVVELCGDTLNWTPGLVNTQYQDDADPVTDIYCAAITGSNDPNDKTGYPTGVGNNHYIYPNQQLRYAIRFQNTGNDTAFTVVIRDTLDQNLNIFTVTPGIASHPYTFQMYGPRVLEWRFDNILLPDSNVNESISHGFVTFTVDQNVNLPFGTEIFNEAGIYFDFNAPVITNQTLHTLYDFELDIITDVQPITSEDNSLHVYPNPASTQVYLEFPVVQEQSEIILMNMLGQKMYSTNVDKGIAGTSIAIERFPKGIYFVMLNSSKKVSSKKLVIY